jgi:type I restriction enzyme R subunit
MLDYIVQDFEDSRVMKNDYTTGAMVICDSAEQAEEMARLFEKKYAGVPHILTNPPPAYPSAYASYGEKAAEAPTLYALPKRTVRTHALILHDAGSKSDRKELVDAFKEGKIDILFVFNMLLTGFDAARLKKLYLGRIIKAHNLLQALTRVNRPYPGYRYGSVVDFVNIEAEFAKTNKDYFDELQSELGDELQSYSDLFKTEAEITADIEGIKDTLFHFNTENAEIFSQQISQITAREEMRKVVKALNDAKSLYNLIRLAGQYELLAKLDFRKLTQLSTEANNHLTLLNQREALEHADDGVNLLNIAMEDVLFTFRKVSEAEMVIADELREQLRRTREGLGGNFDQGDPAFVTLKEELERLFKKKNIS